MLDILHRVENQLPEMLQEEADWNSLFIDYHPPVVERLWRQWFEFRIYLHRIHPCEPGEALFHPHPWPSAMHVLDGAYEMAIGYGTGEKEPPIAARIILRAGAEYEMTDPHSWHYVRPLDHPSMSLMIAGKPWDPSLPKSGKVLDPLAANQKEEILKFFRAHYGDKNSH